MVKNILTQKNKKIVNSEVESNYFPKIWSKEGFDILIKRKISMNMIKKSLSPYPELNDSMIIVMRLEYVWNSRVYREFRYKSTPNHEC